MITLRKATPADIPVIRDIAEKTWPVSYSGIISPAQIRYMLDLMYSHEKIEAAILDPDQSFWLAETTQKTLGFCSIQHRNPGPVFTRIHKLYILPDTQGLGIGQILMNQAESEARKAGSNSLHLNVNKYNKALGFYQKLGFQIDSEEILEIGNGYVMDDYILIKVLD